MTPDQEISSDLSRQPLNRALAAPGARARERVVLAAVTATAGIGAAVMIAWLLPAPYRRDFTAIPSMKFNPALALVFSAAALWLLRDERGHGLARRLGQACAVFVFLMGALTLAQDLFGFHLGIDERFVRDYEMAGAVGDPGRMAQLTSVEFLVLAATLLVLHRRTRRGHYWSQYAALATSAVGVSVLIGFALGTAAVFPTGISPHAAAALLCLSLGVLAVHSDRGLTASLVAADPVAAITRRLMPLALLLPLLLSWLLLYSVRQGWVNLNVGVALTSEIITVLLAAAIWISTHKILAAVSARRAVEQDSRQRLALAMKAGESGTFEWDLLSNAVVWSSEMEELYGLAPGEFANHYRNWEALLVPDDRPAAAAQVARAMQTGEFVSEFRIRRARDGEIRWIRARARVLFDPRGRAVRMMGINLDITDRRRAEQALRESENQLRLLLDNLPTAVVLKDRGSNYVFCNRAYFVAIDRDVDPLQARGKTDFDFFPRALAEKYRADDRRILDSGATEEIEEECRRGDHIFAVHTVKTPYRDTGGNVCGVLAVFWDVTEQRRAHDEIQRASLYARGLLEASLDPLVTISSAGKITGVNRATELATGASRLELIGSDFSDYFTDPEQARAGYQRVFADGVVRDYPLAIRNRQGAITEVLYNATVFRNRAGEVEGVFAAARDITERKRADREIRRLNETLELRVAQRTAEIADLNLRLDRQVVDLTALNQELESFTYSVSHDLRSPLRHIAGFAQLLQEECGAEIPAGAQHFLTEIREGTRRMGQLIDDLLNLARVGRQELTVQVTGLNSIVDDVVRALVQENPQRNIEWKIGSLPFLECDPALMRQVLFNLLANSVKFSRPRERAVIEVGSRPDPGAVVVYVRDNGVGFSPRYAGKLFGIFQRLHRSEDFEGTGVGLATVQRIVHKHGGKVWAEGELDRGATFYFSIPLALDASHATPNFEEALHA